MKKVFTILIMLALPLVLMAQGAGGEIRRPVRTNTNSNAQNSSATNNQRNNNANAQTNNKGSNAKPAAQAATRSRDAILQDLINNMVRVEGGTFMMGATSEQGSDAYSDEKPVHQVTLSSFSIGKYEVTQEEWEAVMGSNPSEFKGAKRPVENVSWNDCQAFIRKLKELTGRNFRLPTEAEWEFAARGGTKSIGYKYAGGDNLESVAWYNYNSGRTTHEVGQKAPNELGLYDMSGNLTEWCSDWYDKYTSSTQTNPTGPSSGSSRVYRGGTWKLYAKACRVSYRHESIPSSQYDDLGFRLAL